MKALLEVERRYFEANVHGFMKSHENEYALIYERNAVGFFSSEEEAVLAGRKKYGSRVPFLVALVTGYPNTIQVSTFILGHLR